MRALNYLREATEELRRVWIPGIERAGYGREAKNCMRVLENAAKAQKFIMPEGGKIFDAKLRGLPDALRLPFPDVVIEYPVATDEAAAAGINVEKGTVVATAPKRIVYAFQAKDCVSLFSIIEVNGITSGPLWQLQPFAGVICKDEGMEASNRFAEEFGETTVPGLRVMFHKTGESTEELHGADWIAVAYRRLHTDIIAVLELIEALSCSNVSHEPLPARKLNKSAQKRGALPFDEARVLVLKNRDPGIVGAAIGSHRSPREHLRRGHIRRLADGRKFWINSTVVNAGAAGKITTTYDMRKLHA